MARPVTLYVEEARYQKLETLAREQNTTIEDLLVGRGIDLLLGNLTGDIPRAAAEFIAQVPWDGLERFVGSVQALRALRAALPAKPQ